MCRVLRVSSSGYYSWRNRPISVRQKADRRLLESIREIFKKSKGTYGSPRIYAALQEQGIACGLHRVARLMRHHGLKARRNRKRRIPVTTQRDPGAIPAPNLLKQDFKAAKPHQKWVGDITYIDTAEGWLYLAVVLDLCTRELVGWAMRDHLRASLVVSAFKMAVKRHSPGTGLLFHSDRGSQYTSHANQKLMKENRVLVSMSGTGNCFDNAPAESFFSTLKAECAIAQFVSHDEARRTIFEYIEVWYNRERLHSALAYRSPVGFARQFLDTSFIR